MNISDRVLLRILYDRASYGAVKPIIEKGLNFYRIHLLRSVPMGLREAVEARCS